MGESRRLMRRTHGTHAGRLCDLGGGQHRGNEGNLGLLRAVAGAHACLAAVRTVLAVARIGRRGMVIRCSRGSILVARAMPVVSGRDAVMPVVDCRSYRRCHFRSGDHLRARHGRADPVEDQGGAKHHAQDDGRQLHVPQL